MTQAGRAAIVSTLVVGSLAMACSAGEAERNGLVAQDDARAAQATDTSRSRDRESAEDERSIVDRVRNPDPELIIPSAFLGTWASSLVECRGGGWIRIEPGGFRSPDNIAALLEPARIVPQVTPGGEAASTITLRVEQMSEGDVGVGRVRMSRAGDHLYMSNADIVGEAEHWRMRNVSCPSSGYSEAE